MIWRNSLAANLFNGEGRYLDLWDLRRMLAEGRRDEITAQETITHNGETYTLDDFLDYMTKNAFYFKTYLHLNDGNDSETVSLAPEYYGKAQGNVTWAPDAFWAAP